MTDLAGAQSAIEKILEQGEGRAVIGGKPIRQFVNILDEYQQRREANRLRTGPPVMAANVGPPERDVDVPLSAIRYPPATDLFNVGYEVLLQIFQWFFADSRRTTPSRRPWSMRRSRSCSASSSRGRPDHELPVGEDDRG